MNEIKKVNTSDFTIENNVISFNNLLLQISNISQVNVGTVPKRKFYFGSIIFPVLGIMMLYLKNAFTMWLGYIFITFFIVYVIWLFVENKENEDRYLCFYMNSQNVYYIFCKRKEFLFDIMKVIMYCFNNHCAQEIKIDLINCKLYNSPLEIINGPVIEGDVIINEVDWEMIQDELLKVYQKLPQSSEEYNASRKALNYALNKDEKGFISVLKECARSFTSDLFSGVASGILVELISRFI